ncbi:hypothetical protein LB507_003401 [Fusarium sp. FIESC RH6]|nr:hypothetical protein LB507_003401 [Fusarium sp. FIESC RH6]
MLYCFECRQNHLVEDFLGSEATTTAEWRDEWINSCEPAAMHENHAKAPPITVCRHRNHDTQAVVGFET